MLRPALLFCLLALLAPALPAAERVDFELDRASAALERGQENRARKLYKDYLARHPESKLARQGYVAAGGSLDELGLEPKAQVTPVLNAKELAAILGEAAAPAPVEEEAYDENTPVRDAEIEAGMEAVEEGNEDAVITLEPAARTLPRWVRQLQQRAKRVGAWALLGLAAFIGVGLLVLMALIGGRLAQWYERRRQEALDALVASTDENVYAEYRHWAAWWGIGYDSETGNNRILRQFNGAGWTCLEARWTWAGLLRMPAYYVLLVFVVQLFTFGFMRFYTGPTFLFKRGPASPGAS